MAKRRVIFVDLTTQRECVLPVTPESAYSIDHGMNVETVNITSFGDVHLAGGQSLFTSSLEFFLPARRYAFCDATTVADPQVYLDFFQAAIDDRHVLRYIVSDTSVAESVYIENISKKEQDGTCDVYCTLTMRQYRAPNAVVTVTGKTPDGMVKTVVTGESQRASLTPTMDASAEYALREGDTIYTVSRAYYGTMDYADKLAAYNGIKNAAAAGFGTVLTIPPVSVLEGGGS